MLTQTSEIISKATPRYDSTGTELLALGTAVNRDNPRTAAKTVPIVATAAGEAGELVRLALLVRTKIGWLGNKTVSLNSLDVDTQEQARWHGQSGLIQQLAFAEGNGNATSWLAVRFSGATTILHPVLRRTIRPPVLPYSSHRSSLYPTSRLDPNPIVTLPIERSGGAPHADVSFNPWYEKQFAVVDQEGLWSVWDIKNQNTRRDVWTLKIGSVGNIHDMQKEGLSSLSNKADGWGSVLWACNVHTLLVFGRRSFIICNLRDISGCLVGPDLVPADSGDWILSIKRRPSQNSDLFVVTSSRIFWLRIFGFNERAESNIPDLGAKILLSWRHFRDREDASLTIHLFNDIEHVPGITEEDSATSEPDTTTTLILYSRMTGLPTVYNFKTSSLPKGLPESPSDPYILGLDSTIGKPDDLASTGHPAQPKSIFSLVLSRVEYNVHSGSVPSGPGKDYMESGVRFYQLNILFNDLSLEQSLYASSLDGRSSSVQFPVSKISMKPRSVTKVIEEGSIVPDGVLDTGTVESQIDLRFLRSKEPIVKEEIAVDRGDPWTVNLEWLDRHIQSAAPSFTALERNQFPITRPFSDVLGTIQSVLENGLSFGGPGIRLLYVLY